MSEPVVETIGLTKIFRDFWHREKVRAVDDLNLQLQPGEVFGLLGPNGSGKSTTIKLLLGLLFPTKGLATVFGQSPRSLQVKRRIGFLPEETYLYPYLNAEETLDFYGRIFEIPRAERRRRIDALIRMVGLTGASKRPIGEYSKGMARRIGIAQALIGDPDLILLDEATTGLDPIGTAEVKELILELKSRGKTILLCSHLLADVEDVCDRIGILYAGKIRAVGQVGELLSQSQITQISAEDMHPDTVAAAVALVRQREGKEKDVQVGHPMDRLESFFLRVVEAAHAEQATTTGAQFGDAKADIYREDRGAADKGEAIIQRLMQPADTPKTPAPADDETPAAPDESAAAGAVIERLTVEAEPPGAAGAQPEPESPASDRDKAAQHTKDVVDRLVGETEDGDESEAEQR